MISRPLAGSNQKQAASMPSSEPGVPSWPFIWPSICLMLRLTWPSNLAGSRGPFCSIAWFRLVDAIKVMNAPGTPCPVQSATVPNQVGIWTGPCQGIQGAAQSGLLNHTRILNAVHDLAVSRGLHICHDPHKLQTVADAGESAVARDDEAVGQGFLSVLHRFERQRIDVQGLVDDQRLLVHERNAALSTVQFLPELLAHL